MLDENLIPTLEQSLRQTRNAQNRLIAQLREKETEVDDLRIEISALENSAAQMEKAIDSLLVATRSGSRPTNIRIVDENEADHVASPKRIEPVNRPEAQSRGSVTYFDRSRGIPPQIHAGYEPLSDRFNDRTITQACTLLLREAGSPLHVNELYNLLIAGGMKFKGNNPTISVAVSLSRNHRFRKVDPGTFDLVIREAHQKAS
jgi:hypothetical protein